MTDEFEAGLDRILETVLYCRHCNRDETMRFYDEALGLCRCRIFADRPGVYRIGSSVLLIFNADETTAKQSPPPTGTSGPGHACFTVTPDGYEDWKDRLGAGGVAIIDEIEWTAPLVGRSFYFHDPAGNVLEIADRDIWPPDSGMHGQDDEKS